MAAPKAEAGVPGWPGLHSETLWQNKTNKSLRSNKQDTIALSFSNSVVSGVLISMCKKKFKGVCVCARVRTCARERAYECMYLQSPDTLELELQVVVSRLTWMLGTKVRWSTGAVPALRHRAASGGPLKYNLVETLGNFHDTFMWWFEGKCPPWTRMFEPGSWLVAFWVKLGVVSLLQKVCHWVASSFQSQVPYLVYALCVLLVVQEGGLPATAAKPLLYLDGRISVEL